MKIKQQFIYRDEHKNLQLVVETESGEYFTLSYTNELGFNKITKESFLKHTISV